MDVDEKCKEAFIAAGFWPNEVMWSAWRNAWTQATDAANGRIRELERWQETVRDYSVLVQQRDKAVSDLTAERAVSDRLLEALKFWKIAADNAEECEFDDMAAFSVPMPLFCDADEATDAAIAEVEAMRKEKPE